MTKEEVIKLTYFLKLFDIQVVEFHYNKKNFS